MTIQATFAATAVDELARAGVTDAVVAPGSRSTPMALALVADARMRVHVVLDERSAAFIALGLGLASGRPAVVLTTSGTAAVELHPAVVEAHHARVPLLALTGDRPPDLRDVGAPQTIDQRGLFGGSVRWAGEVDPLALPPSAWRSVVARAFLAAADGPVHLNLVFRDPLVGEPDELPPGRAGGAPFHVLSSGSDAGASDPDDKTEGSRGIVIAGADCDADAVLAFGADAGWPVLADPLSGCRGRPGTVAAFDPIMRSADFVAGHAPDVVVRVGRPPASRVLADWLACLDAEQLVVESAADPARTATAFMSGLPAASGRGAADWRDGWLDAEARAQASIDAVMGEYECPTEPGVARTLTRGLDQAATLFVSSSMPIRDVEWFGFPREGQRLLANRGANGIDGVVSTAIGVALARHSQPVVALVGDLAFLHDSGALLSLSRGTDKLTVVVVDNDGGGIFSFLPQAASVDRSTFERVFGTPHGVDVAAVARAYGLRVEEVDAIGDLMPAVGRARVVHVRTDRADNVAIHRRLNDAVAAAIRA